MCGPWGEQTIPSCPASSVPLPLFPPLQLAAPKSLAARTWLVRPAPCRPFRVAALARDCLNISRTVRHRKADSNSRSGEPMGSFFPNASHFARSQRCIRTSSSPGRPASGQGVSKLCVILLLHNSSTGIALWGWCCCVDACKWTVRRCWRSMKSLLSLSCRRIEAYSYSSLQRSPASNLAFLTWATAAKDCGHTHTQHPCFGYSRACCQSVGQCRFCTAYLAVCRFCPRTQCKVKPPPSWAAGGGDRTIADSRHR